MTPPGRGSVRSLTTQRRAGLPFRHEEQHTSYHGDNLPVGLDEQSVGLWGPVEREHESQPQHGCAQEEAFAAALATGAMAALTDLAVDNPEHPALEAACEARGIDLD